MITKAQVARALVAVIGASSAVGLETHGPDRVGPDEILLEEWIEGATATFPGNRLIHRVKLDDFITLFGGASALTYDALRAINDAPTKAAPLGLGYGKYLDEWKKRGMLA